MHLIHAMISSVYSIYIVHDLCSFLQSPQHRDMKLQNILKVGAFPFSECHNLCLVYMFDYVMALLILWPRYREWSIDTSVYKLLL